MLSEPKMNLIFRKYFAIQKISNNLLTLKLSGKGIISLVMFDVR